MRQPQQSESSDDTSFSSEAGNTTKKPQTNTDYKIKKGTEYAYMSDEWDVYIAKAVSDSIIKIEHWDKTLSSTKEMSYAEDVGVFKISDSENEFFWVDKEQTVFSFTFCDDNNSRMENLSPHIFTINISGSNTYKGTNYNEAIPCYSYKNDNWHLYRAIPLTANTMKIECWSRVSTEDDFCFGWDWCVVDLNNDNTDSINFEWTDDEHTSFLLDAQDPQNDYYMDTATPVLFELDNKDTSFKNVKEYMEINPFEITEDDTTTQQETSIETTVSKSEVTTETQTETQTSKKASVSYSTNTKDTVKNGDSGIYAYKSIGGTYDNYYIIDFDEGYVYYFSDGNGDSTCDRLKIDYGNLNDGVMITYHDGDSVWSEFLHFKWKNQPDHLVMIDHNGFDYDFYNTDLDNAIRLRDTRTIHDF